MICRDCTLFQVVLQPDPFPDGHFHLAQKSSTPSPSIFLLHFFAPSGNIKVVYSFLVVMSREADCLSFLLPMA
jgi:hypothetical protein